MRSGKWIIASCGIVGLVLGHAVAGDRFYGQSRYPYEGKQPSQPTTNTFFAKPKPADQDEAASTAEAESTAAATQAQGQPQKQPARYTRQRGTALPAASKPSDSTGATGKPGFTEELKGSSGAVRTAAPEASDLKNSPVMQAGFEDEGIDTQVRTENGRRVIRDSNFSHAEFSRNDSDSERNHIQQLSGESIQQMGGFFNPPQKSAMMHAEYDREVGKPEQNQIQQLSGSEPRMQPSGTASRFQLAPAAAASGEPTRLPGNIDRKASTVTGRMEQGGRGQIEQAGGFAPIDTNPAKMMHADHERKMGESESGKIQQVRGTAQPTQTDPRSAQRHESRQFESQSAAARSTQAKPQATRTAVSNAQYERARTTRKQSHIRRTQADARDLDISETELDELAIPELPAPSHEGSAEVPPAPSSISAPRTTERTAPSLPSAPSRTEPRISAATFGHPSSHTDSQTPQVTVEWVKKSDINVGQECQCELLVKNRGQVAAHDIAVDAYFPATVRLTAADPQPSESADHLSWAIKEMAAGEEQIIRLSMIPSKRGELETTAFVRFTGTASNVFRVEEPLLAVSARGPKEVMVGDPASQEVTVTNPGTGTAHNVAIEAIVPAGLEHAHGQKLVMEVGSLGPGESRNVRLALAAVAGGEQAVQIRARAEGDLVQDTTSYVTVVAPSLQVGIEGPSLRYVGRNAMFALTVLNDGRADSNNVRVIHKVPEGFKFVRADKGGKFDESSRTITWFVGHLAAGERTELKTELTASQMGDFRHLVGAVSENGARSEGELETHVDGSASLVLELVDLDDPVEVGVETAYEVHVRNDGTIPAQNVGISCELPGGLEFLSAKGPTEFRAENGLIVFRGLGQLDPGKTAVYRIIVKGQVEGNQRVRARLASDSIREPLIFEELTKFYGE